MEERTKERFVRGSQVMGKEGLCVCTPSSSWRLEDSSPNGKFNKQHLLGTNVSARKLGAHLWETFPVYKMGANRRDKISSQVHKHQTEGTYGLMSEAAQASVQLIPTRRRNNYLQPKPSGTDLSSGDVSSYTLSYSDSSPSTSIQARESTSRLRTSAEMVRVLNHLRNLESQKTSSRSHLEALNLERHDSHKRIKDLRRYDQNEQQNVEGMLDKLLESRRNCKSPSTIQALKSELSDERRLIKDLESLNRKLAQDITEVELSLSNNIKELKKERRSCRMVEDLCDMFAKEILGRQSEVTSAKQRRLKENKWLICRIAEAWLDERSQANQHPNSSKLMEAFLKAKFSVGLKTNGELSPSHEERSFHRRSSESFLLNEPADPAHEGNSSENELSCFEQRKRTAARRSTGSSGKVSAMNSQLMVKDSSNKYSVATREHKMQNNHVARGLSSYSSSPAQHLHSKLSTSPITQKLHSLAQRSKHGSLGSHLLEARIRKHYCTPASRGAAKAKMFANDRCL